MRERHTNRRPVSAVPVGADSLLTITLAAEEAGGWLRLIPRDRLVELGSATVYAQRAECADEAWRAEIAQWAGGNRPDGTGVPDSAIPQHPTQTTVPSRDFGQPVTLPVGAAHDLSATCAILHRRADAPVDWLRAGQALSAAWQTATRAGGQPVGPTSQGGRPTAERSPSSLTMWCTTATARPTPSPPSPIRMPIEPAVTDNGPMRRCPSSTPARTPRWRG
jgi:hypothetical protein